MILSNKSSMGFIDFLQIFQIIVDGNRRNQRIQRQAVVELSLPVARQPEPDLPGQTAAAKRLVAEAGIPARLGSREPALPDRRNPDFHSLRDSFHSEDASFRASRELLAPFGTECVHRRFDATTRREREHKDLPDTHLTQLPQYRFCRFFFHLSFVLSIFP